MWAGKCPGDIASFLRYMSKRACWLHGFIDDKEAVACRQVVETLDGEFCRDIGAWLWPPKRPRTHGQWVTFRRIGGGRKETLVAVPPPPPSKNSKPNSWPRMDSLLYVAEWADTILTACNHWLNSAGIGGYPVWEGPQVAEFARVAWEYAQAGRVKHADVYECARADLKRSEVYDDARALMKCADVHFSRLLSWCQEAAKTKQGEENSGADSGRPRLKGESMTNSPQRQRMSLFVGPSEQLQTLATWLDDLNRAAFSHATDGEGSEEFIVDLGALNKVLAVGKEALGCLNIVDAQKCSGLIGELQRDAAARLAGGLDGILEPSAQQQQAGTRLQCELREVMPYLHWLGVCVRDKLAADNECRRRQRWPGRSNGETSQT